MRAGRLIFDHARDAGTDFAPAVKRDEVDVLVELHGHARDAGAVFALGWAEGKLEALARDGNGKAADFLVKLADERRGA